MINYLLAGAIYTLIKLALNLKKNDFLIRMMQDNLVYGFTVLVITVLIWPIDLVGTIGLIMYRILTLS